MTLRVTLRVALHVDFACDFAREFACAKDFACQLCVLAPLRVRGG